MYACERIDKWHNSVGIYAAANDELKQKCRGSNLNTTKSIMFHSDYLEKKEPKFQANNIANFL